METIDKFIKKNISYFLLVILFFTFISFTSILFNSNNDVVIDKIELVGKKTDDIFKSVENIDTKNISNLAGDIKDLKIEIKSLTDEIKLLKNNNINKDITKIFNKLNDLEKRLNKLQSDK